MKINLKGIKPSTYVSIIMVALVAVNYVLTTMGKPLINFSEEQVTWLVNSVLGVAMIVYPAWVNNSVTDKAQYADDILYALRDGKISKEEVDAFIAEHSKEESAE